MISIILMIECQKYLFDFYRDFRVLNSEIFDHNLKEFQIINMVVSPGEHLKRYP